MKCSKETMLKHVSKHPELVEYLDETFNYTVGSDDIDCIDSATVAGRVLSYLHHLDVLPLYNDGARRKRYKASEFDKEKLDEMLEAYKSREDSE